MRPLTLALAALLLVPATAAAQWRPPLPEPRSTTPAGPATLYSDWIGSNTLEGLWPQVLTAFKVTVGPGGRAGRVRFRVLEGPEPGREIAEGEPVTLPAAPGVYTFPAPHVPWDYRNGVLGLDQETGGHAIVSSYGCCAADQVLDVYRPRLRDGAWPDRSQAQTQPEKLLTIEGVAQRDLDQDRLGDITEDRTDLRTAAKVERIGGGRLAVTVTVRNAGRLTAHTPRLTVRLSPAVGRLRWAQPCRDIGLYELAGWPSQSEDCGLTPLAPGHARTLRFVAPDPGRLQVAARVSSEGADLAPADNGVSAFNAGPAPPLALEVVPNPGPTLVAKLRSARAGTVFVTLGAGGRTWLARAVRFDRPGERVLRLRVPPSHDGDATLTARSPAGAAVAAVRVQ
jgi:hypothetical protein